MITYVWRRLWGLIPLLALALLLAFLFMRTAPGGPFDLERSLPPEIEARVRARYHLDEPLSGQFARYAEDLLRGDLGPSFRYRNRPVNEIIAASAPVSLTLGALAMSIALLAGVTTGVVSAMRRGTWLDHTAMGFAIAGISIPAFVLGPLFVLVFSFGLRVLPPAGWGSLHHLVLPALTLAASRTAIIARLTRSGMIETLEQDFVRTARAKGLSELGVALRHALPVAILPVVSYLGPATAATLTGSVVVERIFLVPGLGTFFVQSALNRDYTLAMGAVLFYSALLMLLNLAVDIAHAILDPRVKLE
jgi:oligopeptide transport system permease protein